MPVVSFSIITPSLNARSFIAEAIASVMEQQIPDVEHIIIDGGSTDGTLELLKQYPHLIVVSEPDRGMYDAINKGIRMARGEWIGLLNADDLYPKGSLKQALEIVEQNPDLHVMNGGYVVFEDHGDERRIVQVSPSIGKDELWPRIVHGHTVPNSWFIRRSLFDLCGFYDSRYRFAADRELIMRFALAGIHLFSLPGVNYWFRQHERSATFSKQDSRIPERGNLRIRIALEMLSIQEEYLTKKNLPAEMRKELLKSHSATTYKLVVTALFHRKWRLAMSGIWRGCRYDISWPFTFLLLLVRRIQKEAEIHA